MRKLLIFLLLAPSLLAGCSFSDYAREEKLPFTSMSADEARAELQINAFLSDLADHDFESACREHLTLKLQLLFAAKVGSCEKGFEEASEEASSVDEITVLGSDATKRGLWIRTNEGRYLMQGNRIAYFEP
jgi:hypothetical protein